MIYLLLNHLKTHLHQAFSDYTFYLNYLPGRDAVNQHQSDGIYITLLNITEDVSAKIPYVYHQHPDRRISKQNPPMVLDLNIMISAFFKEYDEGLKAISRVIQKLANTNKFKTDNMEYTIGMYNISMEQNNNLWQALSTNVLPNVIYKIRYVSVVPEVDENKDVSGEVVEINIQTEKK